MRGVHLIVLAMAFPVLYVVPAAGGQTSPPEIPQSDHPADVAARTLQPWETDFVEPASSLDAIDWGHGQVRRAVAICWMPWTGCS